jgi:hypothetical protein
MTVDNKYIEFSIVLAATSNNPTVLNPDFLKYNKIIEDTGDLSHPPICTEPFSQVSFQNGIFITSQLDKIVFSINKNIKNKDQFDEIFEISMNYLRCIPHVNYTGIGINPKYSIKLNNNHSPQEFLINKFVRSEIIDKELKAIGLNMAFSAYKDIVCNLDISSSKIIEKGKQHDIILIAANFHHSFSQDLSNKIKEMENILNSYKNDISFFENEIISKYFSEVIK